MRRGGSDRHAAQPDDRVLPALRAQNRLDRTPAGVESPVEGARPLAPRQPLDMPAEAAAGPTERQDALAEAGEMVRPLRLVGDLDVLDRRQAGRLVRRVEELRHQFTPGPQAPPGEIADRRAVGDDGQLGQFIERARLVEKAGRVDDQAVDDVDHLGERGRPERRLAQPPEKGRQFVVEDRIDHGRQVARRLALRRDRHLLEAQPPVGPSQGEQMRVDPGVERRAIGVRLRQQDDRAGGVIGAETLDRRRHLLHLLRGGGVDDQVEHLGPGDQRVAGLDRPPGILAPRPAQLLLDPPHRDRLPGPPERRRGLLHACHRSHSVRSCRSSVAGEERLAKAVAFRIGTRVNATLLTTDDRRLIVAASAGRRARPRRRPRAAPRCPPHSWGRTGAARRPRSPGCR